MDESGGPAGRQGRDATRDPLALFAAWLEDAARAGIRLPHAMAVATASPDGEPSVRMLLLRDFDDRGFVFFTNHGSLKGRQLAANPRAALVFHWDALERQVRISGTVERVSREESEAYFASRPLGNRLAAWASPQGREIGGRQELERAYAELEARHAGGDVPLPPFWGGYRVAPRMIEFWESRPNRLHDRVMYVRTPEGAWRVSRLAP